MTIGIFDSGRGGQFVAEKLRTILPDHDYIVIDDRDHAPYGERTLEDVAQLTDAAIQPILASCDIIVLACNTATVGAISMLREKYPNTTFVGFEPMIKQAALQSKTGHITLLATAATASSPRTKELTALYAPDIIIDTPDTTGWASMIDAGRADDIDLSEIAASIQDGSDTIIIGCTHYLALIERIESNYPSAPILEPTEAVARRINQLAG